MRFCNKGGFLTFLSSNIKKVYTFDAIGTNSGTLGFRLVVSVALGFDNFSVKVFAGTAAETEVDPVPEVESPALSISASGLGDITGSG